MHGGYQPPRKPRTRRLDRIDIRLAVPCPGSVDLACDFGDAITDVERTRSLGNRRQERVEGKFADYEADRKARFGEDALVPKRIKYRKLTH